MEQNLENNFKSLTKNHYDKFTFIEPNLETDKRFIENNELFLGLLHLEDIKEPLIEVGCGTGKYLRLLELAGKKNILGIDISPNSLKIAGKYLKYSRLKEGDAMNLTEFKDESFKTVICAGVAHHTPVPKKVFSECARICEKNGAIIFGVYRKNSLYYYDYIIFSKAVKLIFKLKAEKFFFPMFKLWFFYLSGSFPDKKTLSSLVTDRYLSPVVEFFTLNELKQWIKEQTLELLKVSYTYRKSLINILLKKPSKQ